jgi:pimeloyl-ACP methyl ester carboxylesterase
VSDFLKARGARLALASSGSGSPFVWCHGLTSSRAHEDAMHLFDWSGLGGGVRLVRYDARGHGESEAGGDAADYRWERLAEDLLEVADALGLERFTAGGASMGAATVLHAAAAAPERLRGLVLAIPPTAWETRAAQARLYEAAARLVETQGLAAFLEAMASQPPPAIFAGQDDPYRVPPSIAECTLPTVLRGAATSDLPPPERIRALSMPALILAWDTDPSHPLSTARRLAELLPDARLEIAHRASEVPLWPRRVREFLAELELPAGAPAGR